MEEITNGGLPEVVTYKAAERYWRHYIDMEFRDPNGLNKEAKAALAMFKHIAKLEEALRNIVRIEDNGDALYEQPCEEGGTYLSDEMEAAIKVASALLGE